MPFSPSRFHPTRPNLTAPVRVDPLGRAGPTRKEARGPRFRRTSHGLYVPADVDGRVPEQRIVEAAAVLPEVAGVTGWAALRWCGGIWFDGMDVGGERCRPVTLATGFSDILNQDGIHVCQERLDPAELFEYDGIVLTTPVRSLCFEMRYASCLREAVVAASSAAYSDLVSIEELADYASQHPGWTGIPQCREAIGLMEENSWSPAEDRMRLVWVIDAELPRPLCNVPIFDRGGRHIGTPDLLDVEAGLVCEYDGSLHLEGARRRVDIRREEAFRGVGLETFTVMAGDAANRWELAERMRAARNRARFEVESCRRWTIDPPSWWTPTVTVAQRRALEPVLQARLLANRRLAG